MPATKEKPQIEKRDQFPGNGVTGSRRTAEGKYVPIIWHGGNIDAACIECDSREEANGWAITLREQRRMQSEDSSINE